MGFERLLRSLGALTDRTRGLRGELEGAVAAKDALGVPLPSGPQQPPVDLRAPGSPPRTISQGGGEGGSGAAGASAGGDGGGISAPEVIVPAFGDGPPRTRDQLDQLCTRVTQDFPVAGLFGQTRPVEGWQCPDGFYPEPEQPTTISARSSGGGGGGGDGRRRRRGPQDNVGQDVAGPNSRRDFTPGGVGLSQDGKAVVDGLAAVKGAIDRLGNDDLGAFFRSQDGV